MGQLAFEPVVGLEVVAEPVRAEQEAIPGGELEAEVVRFDALLGPDRLGQGVAPAAGGDLLGLEDALPEQLRRDGLVLAELVNSVSPGHIEAAVADVGHDPARACDQEERQGAAHALLGRVLLSGAVNGGVGRVDCSLDQGHQLAGRDLSPLDAGQELSRSADGAGGRADCHGRGHVARAVSAHSVRHEVEPELVVSDPAVLVVGSLLPNVGESDSA